MVKLFDTTFITGSVLVLLSLGIAFLAITREELPVIGTGIGALIAIAVVGMAGCAVGGISQAPALGWTAPSILFGTVLGIAALVIIAAGAFGWTAVLDPIARVVPFQAATATPVATAIFSLATVIAVKWIVAIGMAATAR